MVTGGVLAQLPQDLVHLESRQNGLDQHRGPDGAARNAQCILSKAEYIVPKPGFEMALHFRKIKIRRGSFGDQRLRIVEGV